MFVPGCPVVSLKPVLHQLLFLQLYNMETFHFELLLLSDKSLLQRSLPS